MDLELQDAVVLVTGGSSGIGLATIRKLLAEGAHIVTCARGAERLAKAIADLPAGADRVLAVPCDVRQREAVEELFAKTTERFGRLDGLVNNAGQARHKTLREATREDWWDELDLKFSTVLNTVEFGLPLLAQSERASIVNINATLATEPARGLATTSAARAGLLNLSHTMAQEYGVEGIRVNSVACGAVDSGQWFQRFQEAQPGVPYAQWLAEQARGMGIPLGRVGTPDDIASAIVLLLSPVTSFITGSVITVNGGAHRGIH